MKSATRIITLLNHSSSSFSSSSRISSNSCLSCISFVFRNRSTKCLVFNNLIHSYNSNMLQRTGDCFSRSESDRSS